MGDIIYTTPVVRCLKLQLPGSEIHFLTKEQFKYIYENNPYVDKLHILKPALKDTIQDIKSEKFDLIVDLHNNLRTSIIKLATGLPATTYKKERLRKWLGLKLKLKQLYPKEHLVDRYLKAVKFLGVVNDNKPIDYYVAKAYELEAFLPATHLPHYTAFIIGATHFTKRMPVEKVIAICRDIHGPIVLMGGPDVVQNAKGIQKALGERIYSTCGKTNLDQSVFIVSHAKKAVGFDTGLTHIAEAFNLPLVSIWGSTAPELLGVFPYKIDHSLEAGIELPCRPCTKFGREACPLGHFKCMKDIPNQMIVEFINQH